MARRNRTGPEGKGPMTGRGLGACVSNGEAGAPARAGRGAGMSNGFGPGNGRGAGRGRGPLSGLCLGRGRFFSGKISSVQAGTVTAAEEKGMLQTRVSAIKAELAAMESRIAALEGEK